MAITAKQILILASSFFLITCGEHKTISSENNFGGDYSVNGFTLRETSFLDSISNLPDIIDDLSIGEFIGFSNASSSEYLLLVHENGGARNQYNYFYLTDSIQPEYIPKIAVLPDTAFVTTLGAHIGIPETEFCEKYKKIEFSLTKNASDKIYELQDTVNQYRSIYIFNKGHLKHIEFGYVW